MSTLNKIVSAVAVATGLSLIAPVVAQPYPMGTAVTYQGRLLDGGLPADDPNGYDFEFTLYDDPSAGSVVAGPVVFDNHPVARGLFTVTADFGSGVFTGNARWLRIGVRPWDSAGAYTYLNPRQRMAPAPYALYSLQSGGSGSSPSPGPRGVQEFAEAGEYEWVAPSGVYRVMVELWGGSGGGGGGGSSVNCDPSPCDDYGAGGGGGGAGGYLRLVVNVTPEQTYTVRIGSAGVGGAGGQGGGAGADGTDGGPTQFEESQPPLVLALAGGGAGGDGGGGVGGPPGAGGAGGAVSPIQGIARAGGTGVDGGTVDEVAFPLPSAGGSAIRGTLSAPHGHWAGQVIISQGGPASLYLGLSGGFGGHLEHFKQHRSVRPLSRTRLQASPLPSKLPAGAPTATNKVELL